MKPLDGKGAWLVGDDEEWAENPRRVIREDFFEVVTLWRLSRSGLGGIGALPEAGGLLDQPAWLLDAFDVLSSFAAKLDKAERS